MQTSSKYQKQQLLGAGDTGRVFRGEHVELRRAVAIKELSEQLRQNPRRRDRFLKEADIWARLSHEQLLTILDIDRASAWVIMELMPGSAAADVRQAALPPARVQDILRQALTALAYLHGQGYLHGNLKPGNVLYDDRGRVKLADGRGIRIGGSEELPAPTGFNKYLAPEMVDDAFGTIGPATDLYCLGFVALELLAGPRFNTLFRGASDSADEQAAWLRWHGSSSERRAAASDVAPGVPHSLSVILERLLSKDLAQRYHQAHDVLEDLHRAQSAPAVSVAKPAMQVEGRPPAGTVPRSAKGNRAQAPTVTPGAIAARPGTPIVLRIASGPRSGEMLGLDGDEFLVGDDELSHLRFLPKDYPHVVGRSLRFRREAEGWKVYREGAAGGFLDEQPLGESSEVRSGSIVRMSPRGPDFQVIFQSSSAPALPTIAMQFSGSTGRANRGAAPSAPAAPSEEPRYEPAAPSLTSPAAAPVYAPVAPSPPQGVGPAPPEPPRAPASSAPSLPVTAATAGWAPAPPTSTPSNAKAPKKESRPSPLNPRNWSKNTQNWVVGIVSGIIALAVVIWWPVSDDGSREAPPPSQAGEPATPSDTDAPGPDSPAPEIDGEAQPAAEQTSSRRRFIPFASGESLGSASQLTHHTNRSS